MEERKIMSNPRLNTHLKGEEKIGNCTVRMIRKTANEQTYEYVIEIIGPMHGIGDTYQMVKIHFKAEWGNVESGQDAAMDAARMFRNLRESNLSTFTFNES